MKVKVLIVDDSAFMRKIISDLLQSDPNIEVVGSARNGAEALEKIKICSPDVITMDIEMPVMNGIQCLERVMELHKIPVIMLSSLTIEGADSTLKALDLGAVDFITKPTSIFNMENQSLKKDLIEKVRTASKIKICSSKTPIREILKPVFAKKSENKDDTVKNIIAIGTSTGGPRALQSIIPSLPENIDASILVVQHMPPGFTKSLATRLNSISQISVKEAEDGEIIKKGTCYIAPGDYHMTASQNRGKFIISLNKNQPISGHRPSVDVMMNSVSFLRGVMRIGVILTGMGSDGADGISSIKKIGGYTIAQDENSSVVYGMPKVAISKGVIDKILPLDKISYEIINKVGV